MTDRVAEALTKIYEFTTAASEAHAEWLAANEHMVYGVVETAAQKERRHQATLEHAPTYLAALVEVGKAAANVRRQYEIDAIGLRWDIIKADVAKNNAAASINDLFAALDALTKAVQ